MNATEQHLLVRSLARLESIWRPIRHAYKQGPAIYQARHSQPRAPWGSASGVRSWKQDQRARDGLAAAGYFLNGEVTAEGRRLARSWVWTFTRKELTTALQRLTQCVERDWCRSGGLVPETYIAGHPWGNDTGPFADLQALFIPALTDGWLLSGSTTQGQAFYSLATDNLPAAIDQSIPPDGSSIVGDLVELYYEEYRATWQRLLHDQGRYQDIGEIPLSVGMPMVDESRDYNDVPFQPLFDEADDG